MLINLLLKYFNYVFLFLVLYHLCFIELNQTFILSNLIYFILKINIILQHHLVFNYFILFNYSFNLIAIFIFIIISQLIYTNLFNFKL